MTIETLIENFQLLGEWEERYAYLMDLGKKLPGLSAEEKVEANRVHGCQAMVWLTLKTDAAGAGRFRINADSDAFVVRGLISVLLMLFDGRTAEEIARVDARAAFSQLGLDRHLSPTRKNGLFAMVERIRTLASAANSRAQTSPIPS